LPNSPTNFGQVQVLSKFWALHINSNKLKNEVAQNYTPMATLELSFFHPPFSWQYLQK
jgi:hypothetical protein